MKYSFIFSIGALATSAFADGTDTLSARIQALEQGKVAPIAQKTAAPTPTALAKETAHAAAPASQPTVASAQPETHCAVTKQVIHTKKKSHTVAKRKPIPLEKEKIQASLTPVVLPIVVPTPELEVELPAHGEQLQTRLAKENVEEETDEPFGALPGAKIEVSTDRLSFNQERNFQGNQTQGMEFPPTPTPQPRPEQRK